MKRNFNKLLSLVLVLMMVVSTMVIVPLTANAEDAPAGFAIDGVDGTGTVADPYVLSTAAECDLIKTNNANLVSPIYMELDADITVNAGFTFESSVWGNKEWHFDGKGHTMSGFTTMLFAGGVGEFKNLTIANSAITHSGNNVGGLLGYVPSATLIENCVMAEDVTITSTNAQAKHCGAFVGYSGNVTILNCINNADVSNAAGNAGGIMGDAYNGTVTIKNCLNTGDVTGKRAGGIFGVQEGTTLTIENCINKGNIFGEAAAPIIGGVTGGTTNVKNTYNLGTISALPGHFIEGKALTVNNTLSLAEVEAAIAAKRAEGGTPSDAIDKWVWTVEGETEVPTIAKPDGEGTEASPYLIDSAAKLAWLSASNTTDAPTSAYWAVLTKNIDLDGKAWAGLISTTAVAIHLDGQNHTIYNLNQTSYTSGFISIANGPVEISNLHFVGAKVGNSSKSCAGTVIGSIYAAINMTNVTVDATSIVIGPNRAGGFIGDTNGSANARITLNYCVNEATVIARSGSATAGDYKPAGGFIGYVQVGENTLNYCLDLGYMHNRNYKGDNNFHKTALYGAFVGVAKQNVTITNTYAVGAKDTAPAYSDSTITSVVGYYSAAQAKDPANAAAIKAINAVFYAPVITTESKNLEVRLKLTDDFGFMASAKMYAGADEAGFVFSTEAITDANVASLAKTKGAADGDKTYAAYTGLTAATLDTVIYFAAYVTVDGETYYSAAREINCADLAEDLADDGKLGDAVITTNASEIALYAEMVKYHNAYKAYLDSVTPA